MPRKRLSDESIQKPSTSKRRRRSDDQVPSQINASQINASQINTSQINNNNNCNYWNRSGKVIRIQLKNFMCHGNLEIDFNPRINLLIGRNGSGKSAILTALVIGLGARTNKTNRSANLKNLIKAGESQASIEIEIANSGNDGYDRDTYGDKIIVKRKLMASGGSSYEIKDESGHVVSKSRDDLMKMLMFHNIQTDNPVFVLNQDAARSFLKDLDPLKNYTLFLKATQMELILEKLNACLQLYNEYKAKLGVSKRMLESSEQELKVLQEKYERLKSVENIKIKIQECKLQRLWLKVSKQEEKVQELQEEIATKESERSEISNKITGNCDNSSLQNRLQELESEVIEKNAILSEENNILSKLRTVYKEETSKYQAEAQQKHKLEEKCKHIRTQIETLENEIAQRTESCSSRNNRLREENEEKKAQLNGQRKEVEAMISTLKQDLKLNEQNKEKQEDEYQTMKMQRNSCESRINSGQQELSRIVSSKNDRTEMYGHYMSSLLAAIDRAHKAGKFSACPKGPLGRYIEVPDKKWRGVVELLIRVGPLTCFLVNSGQDRMMLDRIIKTHCPEARHMIITSKFRGEVYDVRKGAVPKIEDAYLLMDLIKCEDPDVVNCLIDQVRIETILIVEKQEIAEQLTEDESNVPPNLQKILLTDPLIEYYPSPMYRAYSLKPRTPRYIQVNMDERKIALREEIRRNQQLVQQIDSKLQKIRQTLGDFQEYRQQKQILLRKHESTLNRIELQVEELNKVELPSENEDEILRKELEKLKTNLIEMQNRSKSKDEICLGLKQQVIEKGKEVQKQNDKIKNFEAQVNSIVEELNSKKLEVAKVGNSLRTLKTKLDKLDASLSKLKPALDGEIQQLELCQEEAQNLGDRINTRRTDQELSNLIRSLEVKIGEICSSDEKLEDVETLLNHKELKIKKDRQCIVSIQDILDLFKKSRQQRFRTLKLLHEHMAIRVSHTFKHILKIRKFEGELEIDHLKKTLNMTIVPRDKHIEDAVSSTKSLSGGERSFATVALLLSLWSCIDHPFYFLDEYDVFTDEFNRKIITKLLLNEASKKTHRQYTFLSPQDMSFVEASDTIKIHRLADPRSSQEE